MTHRNSQADAPWLNAHRIGVLGGTFDPIHHGHLLMAQEAVRHLGLDKVLFVPVGRPSHRDPKPISCATHRCAMTHLARAGQARYELSRVDVLRPRPTYTVDTIRDLRTQLGPVPKFHLIIGADNLANLWSWAEVEQLSRWVHFVGCSRPGCALRNPGLPTDRLTMLQVPKHNISSSGIRRLVREGRTISRLTPVAVADYIREHGLYRRSSPGSEVKPRSRNAQRIARASSKTPAADSRLP